MKHYVLDACAMVAMLKRVYNEAARIKGIYHRLSLADAVEVATAIDLSGIFVTADHHELETIESKEMLNFLWFR